jgi:hypothetical protein
VLRSSVPETLTSGIMQSKVHRPTDRRTLDASITHVLPYGILLASLMMIPSLASSSPSSPRAHGAPSGSLFSHTALHDYLKVKISHCRRRRTVPRSLSRKCSDTMLDEVIPVEHIPGYTTVSTSSISLPHLSMYVNRFPTTSPSNPSSSDGHDGTTHSSLHALTVHELIHARFDMSPNREAEKHSTNIYLARRAHPFHTFPTASERESLIHSGHNKAKKRNAKRHRRKNEVADLNFIPQILNLAPPSPSLSLGYPSSIQQSE